MVNIYNYSLKLFQCHLSIDTHNVIHGWGSDQIPLGSSPLIPMIKNKAKKIFNYQGNFIQIKTTENSRTH